MVRLGEGFDGYHKGLAGVKMASLAVALKREARPWQAPSASFLSAVP